MNLKILPVFLMLCLSVLLPLSSASAGSAGSITASASSQFIPSSFTISPHLERLAKQFDLANSSRAGKMARIGWNLYDNGKSSARDLSFKVRAGIASSVKNPRAGIVLMLDW